MKQGIADLLKSDNIEDFHLGLIMARQSKVSATETARLVRVSNVERQELINCYFRSTHMGKKYKWRKNV